ERGFRRLADARQVSDSIEHLNQNDCLPNGSAMLMRGKSLTCRLRNPLVQAVFDRRQTIFSISTFKGSSARGHFLHERALAWQVKNLAGSETPGRRREARRQVVDWPRISMAEPFVTEFVY